MTSTDMIDLKEKKIKRERGPVSKASPLEPRLSKRREGERELVCSRVVH